MIWFWRRRSTGSCSFLGNRASISAASPTSRDRRGRIVSQIQNEAEEFLLEGSEPIPKRTLATLIEETKSNTKSRVDVSFPLQPARFIRLDLSLADQFYSMAEFQVYGEGVPTNVNYVSTAIPLDEPVNFGEITYSFRSLRRDREADVLVEDPEGTARLLIETRSGTDDTPLGLLRRR